MVLENIPSLYKRSRECYRGSGSSECGRGRTLVARGMSQGEARNCYLVYMYNRVSFCSLIGHFSILLNPCRNDIMLPAEWLN